MSLFVYLSVCLSLCVCGGGEVTRRLVQWRKVERCFLVSRSGLTYSRFNSLFQIYIFRVLNDTMLFLLDSRTSVVCDGCSTASYTSEKTSGGNL